MTNDYIMQDSEYQKKMVKGTINEMEAYYDFQEPGKEAVKKSKPVEMISLSEVV